jgi:hypothetical protein
MRNGVVKYYDGIAIREIDENGTWMFEVDGESYTNVLKSCLDYSCERIYPGMKFKISEFALDASEKL